MMGAEKKEAGGEDEFKMEIRVIENKKDAGKLAFLMKDTTAVFANTLRRLIVDELPTMAVDEVEFRKNSSILYDELIAHRVGLVPLKTDLKSYKMIEKEEDRDSLKCACKLVLKAKGPGVVYSGELKSKDPAIVPVERKIPIVELMKGQSLEFEATAILGRGKEHVKWNPGHVYYRFKPQLNIGNVKNPEEVLEATHGGVFELKNNKLEVVKDNLFKVDLAGAAEDASQGSIKEEKSNDIIFVIESWGQLPCKTMVVKALDEFDSLLDNFSEALKKAK